MAEFEGAVREALRTAVPSDLEAEPYALIDGAARYARGARTSRLASGATAAVLLAALVVTTSWLVLVRPPEDPARPAPDPVVSRLCRDLNPTTPPRQAVGAMGGAAAVLCPTAGPEGAGWDLPGAPLTLEKWVGYLRAGVAADAAGACPVDTPVGRPFTVVIERLDGQRTAYRSADLACGGRVAVARYLAALAYQRAAQDAANISGYTLTCSPPDVITSALTVAEVKFQTPRATGLLCIYPQFDPGLPGRLVARDYRAVPLDAGQLAMVNSELAGSPIVMEPGSQCRTSRWELTLRLVTPGSHAADGESLEFIGGCADVLRLNRYALWWRPSEATRSMLGGLVPTD
jgi:hypothetical protein